MGGRGRCALARQGEGADGRRRRFPDAELAIFAVQQQHARGGGCCPKEGPAEDDAQEGGGWVGRCSGNGWAQGRQGQGGGFKDRPLGRATVRTGRAALGRVRTDAPSAKHVRTEQ